MMDKNNCTLTKTVVCPHCGEELLDMHNGSDPGEWWENQYIPEGELDVECDHCKGKFRLLIEWVSYFTSVVVNDGIDKCKCCNAPTLVKHASKTFGNYLTRPGIDAVTWHYVYKLMERKHKVSDMKRGAPKKYNEDIIPVAVRLPESLLHAIDAAVVRDGAKSRSEWIVRALKLDVE
jgi:hypothetical protein